MSSFNVFVIGPMGREKDMPGEESTPISQHMQNIKSALLEVIPRYTKNSRIYSPLDGGSHITDFVFAQIDDADLGVADITTRSPSVMYELAIFHALGIPVIVIDDGTVNENRIPFYLKDVNILQVRDFSVSTLISELNNRIFMLFNDDDEQNFSLNPITGFYSAPLVEVSGADAVARGYFDNLIHPILNASGGVISKYSDLDISKFCVIRPSNNLHIQDDLRDFRKIASKAPQEEEREERVFSVRIGGYNRKVNVYLIGNTLYDYPRTIGMLANSPRFIRLTKSKTGKPISNPELALRKRDRLAEKLIKYFFETISAITSSSEGRFLLVHQYNVISMEEFRDQVGSSASL